MMGQTHRLLNIFLASSLSFSILGCAMVQQKDNAPESTTTTTAEEAEKKDTPMAPSTEINRRMKMSAKNQGGGSPGLMAQSAVADEFQQPRMIVDGEEIAHNTEGYDKIDENPFLEALKNPLSTFSIDVDTASYSNIRRFLKQGQKPPKDAVRVEELINYFNYDYPNPQTDHPFSLTTELAPAPWNTKHQLLHVGLKGKTLDLRQTPASNLVFLLDVSGSMNSPNKLPLLKRSLKLLVENLREKDKVAIVVYAGAAGEVLPATSATNQQAIMAALDRLEAGGSTAGGAGIKLAYKIAKQNMIPGGNNRVILATDGDFNVGASSDAEMERLIEEKRKDGIFLTVLGFGMGNYKDNKMEKLADQGNGNYAYIDDIGEARKVLVSEVGATLHTIAKDVKLQLEFNPAKVASYRLIGYENRMLAAEDFDNDKKDAGELGAGHTVTALYEIVPAKGIQENQLKYSTTTVNPEALRSSELVTLKLRYKQPKAESSQLLSVPVKDDVKLLSQSSNNFRFSAAVAGFGMLLRDSKYKGDLSYAQVKALAEAAMGQDQNGYRKEFVTMISQAQTIR